MGIPSKVNEFIGEGVYSVSLLLLTSNVCFSNSCMNKEVQYLLKRRVLQVSLTSPGQFTLQNRAEVIDQGVQLFLKKKKTNELTNQTLSGFDVSQFPTTAPSGLVPLGRNSSVPVDFQLLWRLQSQHTSFSKLHRGLVCKKPSDNRESILLRDESH